MGILDLGKHISAIRDLIMMIIHGQAGGYWVPKYELVPKVTVDQKKRRQAKNYFTNSFYEFVCWIRIFATNSVWAASQIRIGPLIFPLIRQIRGEGTIPPPLPMYEGDHDYSTLKWRLTFFLVFICFIISYLLGKLGVVFFILAYVLGKFVPL